MRTLKRIVPIVLGLIVDHETNIEKNRDEKLVQQAREELNLAYNVFSNVSEPELVEIAVLNIKVAEKRFDFLIKELKRKQLD